ncbi:MAG TPA: hypothetical protein VGN26_08630 [Armatimonadota bacterium]|jgi:hypothetical protein
MTKNRHLLTLAVALGGFALGALVAPTPASAQTTLQFSEVTNDHPALSASDLAKLNATVTFSVNSAAHELTVTVNNTSKEDIFALAFNSPSTLTGLSYKSGYQPGISASKNVSDFGTFDYLLKYQGGGGAGAIGASTSITTVLSYTGTATNAGFGEANSAGFVGAAHFARIKDISCLMGSSTWGAVTKVPDASGLALLLPGLAPLGLLLRRRRG